MDALFDKAMQILLWLLPGFLLLLGIILIVSLADRQPRDRDSDKQ